MTLKNSLTIGLTGSFGSGCTITKDVLVAGKFKHGEKTIRFKGFSLSDFVKEEWLKQNWTSINPNKPLSSATRREREEALEKAKRFELQDIGNEIRRKRGNYGRLAGMAADKACKDVSGISGEIGLVFDGIRNTAEIRVFRERFPEFFLIAVDCERTIRWNRIKQFYFRRHQTEEDFDKDDERDRGEEVPYGQQVELCVDEADIMIKNEDDYPEQDSGEKKSRKKMLQEKIAPFIDMFSGSAPRTPDPDEFFMGLAYTASLNSKCFKRQVGAIVVDAKENVLSVGYNENLQPLQPCVKNEGEVKCRRDVYKRDLLGKLEREKTAKCPGCGRPFRWSPDFRCKNKNKGKVCNYKLDHYFMPDKALSQCTALHAEARALRALRGGEQREGCVLYTTASPCRLCAVDIANARIKEVVYSEAYTDKDAMEFLTKRGVNIRKFHGVKANAYFKLFSSWRKEEEKRILRKLENL